MDNSSYFRFDDDDDDDDDKTNIYIYLFSQSSQGKGWTETHSPIYCNVFRYVCTMMIMRWSDVQTNECDLQAEKYPIICTHHKLRTNDEN